MNETPRVALQDAILCLVAQDTPTHRFLNEKIALERVDNRVRIAIAGSDDILDWMQNFSSWFQKRIDPQIKGKATSGYVTSADNVLRAIEHEITSRDELHITGHSKGGAVAPIVGLKLQIKGYNVQKVRTFAAPKFSRSELDYPLIRDLARYRARSDYIPEWPEPWFHEWKHHGLEYLIGEEVDNHPGVVRDAKEAHLLPHYIQTLEEML